GHGELEITNFLAAGYNFLPAILFFISLAALAIGWAPKLGKLAYAYLGYNFAITYFGNTLDLPEWFSKPAILNWLPQMPQYNLDIIIFINLTIIRIIFIILVNLVYRKRDLFG